MHVLCTLGAQAKSLMEHTRNKMHGFRPWQVRVHLSSLWREWCSRRIDDPCRCPLTITFMLPRVSHASCLGRTQRRPQCPCISQRPLTIVYRLWRPAVSPGCTHLRLASRFRAVLPRRRQPTKSIRTHRAQTRARWRCGTRSGYSPKEQAPLCTRSRRARCTGRLCRCMHQRRLATRAPAPPSPSPRSKPRAGAAHPAMSEMLLQQRR